MAKPRSASLPQSSSAAIVSAVEVIPYRQMDADDWGCWETFRHTQPAMMTPFFAPQFTSAVQASRGDVEIAVLYDDHRIVGYLPFHRRSRIAFPVGRHFNDAHNIIAAPGIGLDWSWLMRRIGVVAFDFHAMVGDQTHIPAASIMQRCQSFAADLSAGGEAFIAALETEHRTIKKQQQKTRKMQRELGPLRFELDCRDPLILSRAIEWKREQYRRTNILDHFLPPWTRQLIHHLHELDVSSPCRGLVSALWAGDTLVAAHVGMLQCNLLHYWFPVYNSQHANYSPGTALFKIIATNADQLGITTIDMGYGEQPYKRKQTDMISEVTSGCITSSHWVRATRMLSRWTAQTRTKLPMKQPLKRILRQIKPDAGIGKLR